MGAERKQLIVVDVDELRTLIGEAIIDALAAQSQAPANQPSPWLNTREVCELLRVSEPTLIKLVRSEGLPRTRVGTTYRFHREHVEAWISNRALLKAR